MPEQPIMLKVLLGRKHWQNYATFCAEYDKAAIKAAPLYGAAGPASAPGLSLGRPARTHAGPHPARCADP
jgi:hypothetical protein